MTIMNIALIIFMTLCLILLYSTLKSLLNMKRAEYELKKIEVLSKQEIHKEDIDLLDSIISEAFENYKAFTMELQDNAYINSDLQKKILIEVLDDVLKRVSDNLIDKISLCYKRDYIEDLIYTKVSILVLDYTIQVNGSYKE